MIVVTRKDGSQFVAHKASDDGFWPMADDGSLFLIPHKEVRHAHFVRKTEHYWDEKRTVWTAEEVKI